MVELTLEHVAAVLVEPAAAGGRRRLLRRILQAGNDCKDRAGWPGNAIDRKRRPLGETNGPDPLGAEDD